MSKSTRMFEIIQILRAAREPITADTLASTLEVTVRTVYRDIATLQGMRVPIAGEAGVGYVMRPGYDLPPLMFDIEEAEAVMVGLALIGRTRDNSLAAAATRVARKISDVLPNPDKDGPALYASDWTAIPDSEVSTGFYRKAVRDCCILKLDYVDEAGAITKRSVKPIALVYYIDVVVLAAWCLLRQDFRHFRLDRIASADRLDESFVAEAPTLRKRWETERQDESPPVRAAP